MQKPPSYVGIDNEINGGMTDTAKVIRDAWVFGLIPESETCEGWLVHELEDLWGKVNAEWEKHGFSVARLPDEMRENFMRIQSAAMAHAKAEGWTGEQELQND